MTPAERRTDMSRRPVWRRDIGELDGFYVEVYRMTFGHWWGWHVWSADGSRWSADGSISVYSFLRRGPRRFRFLAVRDALREVATLRGGAA